MNFVRAFIRPRLNKPLIMVFCRHSSKGDIKKYLDRQMTDPYAKLARGHSYRARSAFKLLEINERFRIIKPGDIVLDVGCAPGSWCQVLSELIFPVNAKITKSRHTGYILGVDLQPILPIKNVNLIPQADITKPSTHSEITRRLNGRRLNAVLSDMAPNPTGDPGTDHFRLIELCRTLLRLVDSDTLPLVTGGKFLCKIWDGTLRDDFRKELSTRFQNVRIVKPDASRSESAEMYLFADKYLPLKGDTQIPQSYNC